MATALDPTLAPVHRIGLVRHVPVQYAHPHAEQTVFATVA